MSFTIEIASVPDRDAVVAEIWFDYAMVAEMYRVVGGEICLDIYPSESHDPWRVDL